MAVIVALPYPMLRHPVARRLAWLALPVVLLAVMGLVKRHSSISEGKRWLEEQGQSAVSLDICATNTATTTFKGVKKRFVTLQKPEEIQSALAFLDCVGELNGPGKVRYPVDLLGTEFFLILSQPDGKKEYLNLRPPGPDCDLIHFKSRGQSNGPASIPSIALVRRGDYYAFSGEFDRLWGKTGKGTRGSIEPFDLSVLTGE